MKSSCIVTFTCNFAAHFYKLSMSLFLVLDILGTIAFATSGALTAMHKKLDIFGIFIIGFVTAIGGGTLRDVLTGSTPVIWMEQTFYIYTIGVTVLLAILFRRYLNHLRKSLFLFDTIGLGVFTITGVETGVQNGLDPIVSIALGAMTGTFGGVIRDTLCNEIPVIFRKEIYATACIIGALAYVFFYNAGMNRDFLYIATSLTVITIRLVVVRYHISLPSFYVSNGNEEE